MIRHSAVPPFIRWVALLLLGFGVVVSEAYADVIFPETFRHSGKEAPPSLQDIGYFGELERHGNLLTISTDWTLDTHVEGELNVGIRQALTEAVLVEQGDRFDFVMVLSTFPVELRAAELAADGIYWHIRNDVQGIGLNTFDHGSEWGSSGRLQGFIDLGHARAERLYPQSPEYQYLLVTAMHEIMHRWSSYARFVNDSGSSSGDLLGHADSHWHSQLHTEASVMYGHDWRQLDDSSYESGPVMRRYSDLDLYLAGLAAAGEVPPILRLIDPEPEVPVFPEVGLAVEAATETIPIERVIGAEGPRLPDVVESQKHFRAALVLVTRPGEAVSPGLLAAIERFRRDVQRRFSSMARGRAVLHVVPEPLEAIAPGLPDTVEGSSGSETPTVDVEAALDWLEQAQNDQKLWADRQGSRWRDTASALAALRSLRPASVSLASAESALMNADAATLEVLAWQARALPGRHGGTPEELDALIALQRPDGGWGLTVAHQSSVEDTAGMLLAFWDVLPPESSGAALEFLAAARNQDGGWGSYPGVSTQFPPTLSAVEALSLPISQFHQVRDSARDWLAARHRQSGEFSHRGEVFSPGDAARALSLLIGHGVDPVIFDTTGQWLSRRQGEEGDWSGSVFSTAEALRVLGLLELPNLQVMGQAQALPEQPVAGSWVRLTARIANTGRETAPASTAQWYLGDPTEGGTPLSAPIQVPELDSGSSRLVTFTWESEPPSGERELWIVVDGGTDLEEWTLEDNARRLAVTLAEPPEGPELALHPDAASVSPAAIESVPSQVQVTGTLWNHGATAVNDAVLALVDVRQDSSVRLAEAALDVPAGGEVAFDLSFEYDGGQSGQLSLIADPEGLVADENRSNNEVEIDLSVSTGVDLAVEAIALEPEQAPYAGHPLKIVVDLANRGLAAAPAFELHVNVRNTSGELVHEAETSLSLDALSSTRREFDWQTDTPGVYSVVVEADPAGVIDDVDPLDNQLEAPVEVTSAEGINLRLDVLSVTASPDPALEGSRFEVSADVHSDGGEAVPAFSLGLFDGDPRSGGQLLGEARNGASLAPGESAALSVVIEPLQVRGKRTLWLQADSLDEVSETDELDNLHAFERDVLSLPDLMVQVADISLDPAVPVPGEPVTLETRVNNLGEQPAENVRIDLLELNQAGQTLIETRTVETIAEEGFVTMTWSWTLGSQEGVEGLRLVVDPQDAISEQTKANNAAELGLGNGDGPLFATNRYISPNGDGIKDTSLLVFQIAEARLVELVIERPGEVIRRYTDLSNQPIDRGQVLWDGRDETGAVVVDGDYLVRLRSAIDNQDLAVAMVTVDTDRSPLKRATALGRVFRNRLEDFRLNNGEILSITDPEMGPAHAVIDPYSVSLEATLSGVYKTGVRALEPVVSDAWIQARSGETGGSIQPEELAFDGVDALAILAEGSARDEVWLANLNRVDSIEIFKLPNSDSIYELLGFGPGGHIILSERDWRADIRRFVAINPESGQTLETDNFNWRKDEDDDTGSFAFLTDGVLARVGSDLVFAGFTGGLDHFELNYSNWRWSQFKASTSGKFASVHIQSNVAESVVLFRQDDRELEELQVSTPQVFIWNASIMNAEGKPLQLDDLTLGMAWAPTDDLLAVVDADARVLLMVSPQSQTVHDWPSRSQVDYAGKWPLEGGSALILESVVSSVQRIATRLGPLEVPGGSDEVRVKSDASSIEMVKGGDSEDYRAESDVAPIGMVEGRGIAWDDSGRRLMFSTSDLVVARSSHSIEDDTVVLPGASDLYVFEPGRGTFDRVTSARVWPLEGERVAPLKLMEFWYGSEIHLVEEFELPRLFWWSGSEPQRWLEPAGPFYIEEYWPDEAGYSLIELQCPDAPAAPWNSECLPIPVVNLDNPTKRLEAVLATEDLDLGGFATDRNLSAWRIDVSAMDGLGPWRQVAPWSSSEVVDARFLRWPPDVAGPVLLRIQLADKAGNRHQAYRRVILPIDPTEPVIELTGADPRVISPNGDGVQDSATFEYEAILAEPFLLRVLDPAGNEVYSETLSHLPGELGPHAVQWAGQSNAGPVVPDGEYDVELWRYSVPVVVDSTPPTVGIDEVIAPYLEKPPNPSGHTIHSWAMIAADVSDDWLSRVTLESRRRDGSLDWSVFRDSVDWRWIGVSHEDFTERAFRLRAEDSAGNTTLAPVPWPGDHLLLLGAEPIQQRPWGPEIRDDLSLKPTTLNMPDNEKVSWGAQVDLTGADALELDILDLSLDRVDDLHIEFRGAAQDEWQSYEVVPDPDRDGWASLPLDRIPSARMWARLRSDTSNLISNIAGLYLSNVAEPDCLSFQHADFFDDGDIARDDNDWLVFWQAYASPPFQSRELSRVRPGHAPQVLEPVRVGINGARAYRVDDPEAGEITFVYRVRYPDGSEETDSKTLRCGSAPMPMCFDADEHGQWFGDPIPEIDPLTHSRLFWRPHPPSTYPVAEIVREAAGGAQPVEPVLYGADGARLYILERSSAYNARLERAGVEHTVVSAVDPNCAQHVPSVLVQNVPAQDCGANAGRLRVTLLPPEDADLSVEYSYVRSELRTFSGETLAVLFDESNPAPYVPGGSTCPRPELLARGEVDLSGLSPGSYRIVTRAASPQGSVWEDEEELSIHAQSPAQRIDAPRDQARVCVSDSSPSVGIDHEFLDARFAPAFIEAWGNPQMVGSDGYSLTYADAIVPDTSSLVENPQGECTVAGDTPLTLVDGPLSPDKVSPLTLLSAPPSPQSLHGLLDLNIGRIDKAGARSCDARKVVVDSRIETVELAATPVQSWSQRRTPMLTLEGAASLREVFYRGRTHESLVMQMRIYPGEFNANGRLVQGEEPARVFEPVDIVGPTTPALSPAEFELEWNGELEGSWAQDGFYFFEPTFQDGCRVIRAEAELVEIDSTPPVIQIDWPQPAQTIQSNLLEVVGSVSDKYFESYQVAFGLGTNPSTWTTMAESEVEASESGTLALGDISGLQGAGVVRVHARDLLGNESELQVPVVFDTPPPLIQALSVAPVLFGPTGNGELDSTAVTFSLAESASVSLVIADADEVPVKSLLVNEELGQGAHVIEWTGEDQSGSVLPDGRYRVLVSAQSIDDADHVGEAGRDVVVDTTPPQLELLYPDGTHVEGEGLAEIGFEDRHPDQLSWELLDGDGNLLDSGEVAQPSSQEQYGLLALDELEEGRYRLEVEALDRARNHAEVDREFVIDRTPPVIELEVPGDGQHLMAGKVHEVSGAVEDDFLLGWQLAVAMEAEEPDWQVLHESDASPEGLVLHEWLVSRPDGNYLFKLQSVDRAGNESEIVRSVVVDGTPPQAQISTPQLHAWAGSMLEITGTADDPNLGAYRISMAPLDAGQVSGDWFEIAFSEQGVAGGVLVETTPTAASGSYRLHLEAWDRAGNVGESTRDFNYASMPPPPPTGLIAQVENRQDVHLDWQAPAHDIPLAGFHVYRNGESITATPLESTAMIDPGLVEGSYQYTVTAVDEAGNESAPSGPANAIINLTAPTVRIASPEPASRVRGLVDVSGTAYSAEGFASYEVSIQPQAGPAELVRQSATPVVAGTLALWNTTGLPDEGPVSLILEAEDTFGNQASVSVEVVIDNLAPQAPTGLTAEIVESENVQLGWSAGSESDLLGYLVYRNGDPVNWSGTLPEDLRRLAITEIEYLDEVVPDGLHAYRVFAIDQAGNISPPSDPAQVDVDRRAPSLTIVEPLTGHAFEESVRVTAHSDDLDIEQVQFAYRAQGETDWTSLGEPRVERPYRDVWIPGDLPRGDYEIRALAIDAGGLTDPAPPVIAVQYADLTPPQIPLGLSAWVSGSEVSLDWQPVPDDDLAGYYVYRGSSRQNSSPIVDVGYLDDRYWSDEWSSREYVYSVSAVDESGNESERSVPVEVRLHQPELEQPYTPTPYPVTALEGFSVASGTTTGTVTTGNGSGALPEMAVAEDAEFKLEAVGVFQGDNEIALQIEDQGGNLSIPAVINVTHDLPPAPPQGLGLESLDDTLVADWEDHAEPDVIGYRLFLNGNAIPADEAVTTPAAARATYDDPWRALDGDPATAWGDSYTHYEYRRPYIEIEFSEPEIVTALDLEWLPNRQAVDFDILGWSGEVWSPLLQIRGNEAMENSIQLPLPYRTDRVRIQILALTGTGSNRLGLAELGMTTRPYLSVSEWQSGALLDGLYEVEVSAIDGFGFESERSSSLEAGIGDVQPPEPVVLTATVNGSDVILNWEESISDNVSYYSVHRRGAEIAQVASGEAASYTDEGLPNGSYEYVVFAISEAGIPSQPSNTQTVEIGVAVPSVPVDLTVTAPPGGGALHIEWAPGSGPEPAFYRLGRSVAADGPYEPVVEQVSTSHVDSPLDNGVTYYYVVEAIDAAGNSSGPSEVVSGTPVNVVAPSTPEFIYPGMAGDIVEVDEAAHSFAGIAEDGTQVELWRGSDLLAESPAVGQTDALHLSGPESGVGISSTIASHGEWVWAPMGGGDRLFNTIDGSILGPWPNGASRAVWDVANGDLWRFLSSPDMYQRVDPRTGDTELLDLPLETISFASPAPDGIGAVLAGYPAQGQPLGMFRWNRQSGDIEQLEATQYSDFHVNTHAWSPDSQRLAWVRSQRLRVLDLMAGTFTEFGVDVHAIRPAWSPDGRYLAVVMGPSADSSMVQVFDTQTGSVWEPLVWLEAQSIPAWNEDGSRLLFLDGGVGRVVAFPSGEVVEQLEFGTLTEDFHAISWQRFSEILAVSEGDDRLAMLRPSGWFRMDDVALQVGENAFRLRAVDVDGNASAFSGDLLVVRSDAREPDLSVSAQDFTVAPPSGVPGASFEAAAIIRNGGTAPSPATEALLLLTPPEGSARSVLLDVPSLQVGESSTVEWNLGELHVEGVHELLLEIDPLFKLDESARSNNFAERSFAVGAQGDPTLDILMASEFLAPGQPLEAELRLVNPGPAFSGHVQVQIRDADGVLVEDLGIRDVENLPAGESWYSAVTWNSDQVLAGQYVLDVRVHTPSRAELQRIERPFRVQLDAQVEVSLAPEESVVPRNGTARILTGVEVIHSNGVIFDARLGLVATDDTGFELRRWDRTLGTLLPGYQSSEAISWPLNDVPIGTHELRLELTGPSIYRVAVASMTVAEEAANQSLTGAVAFAQSPLALGQVPLIEWEVQAPADTGISALPLRFTLLALPGGTALEAVDLDVTANAGQSVSGSFQFSGPVTQQGDYAVTLDSWSEEDSAWQPLSSHSASALDLIAPDVEIVDPGAGEVIGSPVGLVAAIADAHSPIDQAAYRLGDDGPWTPLLESGLGDYVTSIATLEEGDYELRVRASDAAGNVSVSPSRFFTLDDTPPEILVSGVTDGGRLKDPVAPVIEVIEAHPDEVTIMLDGQPYDSGSTIDGEGGHLLQVFAADLAGNASQLSMQFELDFTAPELAFLVPEQGEMLLDGAVEVQLQTEPGAEVELSRGNAQLQVTADSNGLAVFDSVSLQLGENLLTASAVDEAGNESGAVERTVHWLPPSGVLQGSIIPEADQFPAGATVAGIVELHNPAEQVLSNIEYRFRIEHPDAGTPLSEWYGEGDVPSGATAEFGWNFTSIGWPLGELTLTLEVLEAEDWVELDVRTIVLADVMSPAVSIVAPAEAQVAGSPFDVLIDATDDHSGIASVALSIDGGQWRPLAPEPLDSDRYRLTLHYLPEGERMLAVRAIDDWGNSTEVGPVAFVVDRTAPVISVRGVSDGQVGNQAVEIVVDVQDVHDADTEMRLDGQPLASGSVVSAEGLHDLWVHAEDEAGNESEVEMQFEIDLTAPTVQFTNPRPGEIIASATVLLAGVTEPGSTVHLVGPAGQVTTHADEAGIFQVPDWPLYVGINTIVGEAVDAAGNRGERTELEISYLPEDALFQDRFEVLSLLLRPPFVSPESERGAGTWAGTKDWEAMRQ